MNFNKISKLLIVIVVVLIVVMLFFILDFNNSKAYLELKGDLNLTIYQGGIYSENGYSIIKKENDNNDYRVNVVNNLNINIIGNYSIKYQLIRNGTVIDEVFRNVEVIADPLSDVKLTLNGNNVVYHLLNDPYIDEGATAYNKNIDISNEIFIVGKVNINQVGTYELEYVIKNGDLQKSIKRTVKVIEIKINENINYEKGQIELDILLDEFSYVILPTGEKSYNSKLTFTINENGIYEFAIYNIYGLIKTHIVNVNDYDKKTPTGSCIATIINGNTKVSVNAKDENGILKYTHGNNSFTNSEFILNGELSSVNITVYDKYNNYTDISCLVKRMFDNNMNPIVRSEIITPCNYNWSNYNKELSDAINQIGYKTRDAVAYAALYLAEFDYLVAYSWGGKYLNIGLNPRWGCEASVTKQTCTESIGTDKCIYGLDCTGYTAWAFAQAGFDPSILRTSSQSTGNWGNFNAGKHKYSFRNNQDKVNLIKHGDIVHTEGHVGIVIGTSDTELKVANMIDGVKITYLNKQTGKSVNGQKSFDNFVLFDDFFTMYGNAN